MYNKKVFKQIVRSRKKVLFRIILWDKNEKMEPIIRKVKINSLFEQSFTGIEQYV